MLGRIIYSSGVVLLLSIAACSSPTGGPSTTGSAETAAPADTATGLTILSCDTENPGASGGLHVDIVDNSGQADVDAFAASYNGSLRVELSAGDTRFTANDLRIRFNEDGLCSTDPTRELTDSDGSNRVDLTFANDDQCANGLRRVRGAISSRRAHLPTELVGLQTGSFCCTDQVAIPTFSAPPVAGICAERTPNHG